MQPLSGQPLGRCNMGKEAGFLQYTRELPYNAGLCPSA